MLFKIMIKYMNIRLLDISTCWHFQMNETFHFPQYPYA